MSAPIIAPASPVAGKRIIIGVSGSIAAYKAASLTRLLVKAGAEVQVIMSETATQFITPLTLSTLSKNPVLVQYANPESGEWHNHVKLGLWADLFIVAPATANTISAFANGGCTNLLTATYLSARCPVCVAPAMDLDMWQHPATRRNIALLQSYGNLVIQPGSGELASGLRGEGRLAEPEEIVAFAEAFFQRAAASGSVSESMLAPGPLSGKTALVTAGPTHEAIDPVRFIGNRSSGKMGFAIATELARLGASVTLVSGPTSLPAPPGVTTMVRVESAQQMFEACAAVVGLLVQSDGTVTAGEHGGKQLVDIIVMSAAVADYTPATVATTKIKKNLEEADSAEPNPSHDNGASSGSTAGATMSLVLKKTTDILGTIGAHRGPKQTLMGFALETDNELANATGKLQRKGADFIVLNSMRDPGAGFDKDTNKVTVIARKTLQASSQPSQESLQESVPVLNEPVVHDFGLKGKDQVAVDLCQFLVAHQLAVNP